MALRGPSPPPFLTSGGPERCPRAGRGNVVGWNTPVGAETGGHDGHRQRPGLCPSFQLHHVHHPCVSTLWAQSCPWAKRQGALGCSAVVSSFLLWGRSQAPASPSRFRSDAWALSGISTPPPGSNVRLSWNSSEKGTNF